MAQGMLHNVSSDAWMCDIWVALPGGDNSDPVLVDAQQWLTVLLEAAG
jgi:hypothetical protein